MGNIDQVITICVKWEKNIKLLQNIKLLKKTYENKYSQTWLFITWTSCWISKKIYAKILESFVLLSSI